MPYPQMRPFCVRFFFFGGGGAKNKFKKCSHKNPCSEKKIKPISCTRQPHWLPHSRGYRTRVRNPAPSAAMTRAGGRERAGGSDQQFGPQRQTASFGRRLKRPFKSLLAPASRVETALGKIVFSRPLRASSILGKLPPCASPRGV